jgi:phosphatidylglycerol:prolipoprotein diacylglycerol transferase
LLRLWHFSFGAFQNLSSLELDCEVMITWLYSVIMLVAVVVGALLLRVSQRELSLNSSDKIAIGLGAFCGAIIGAKLPFALSDWEGLRSGAVWFSNGKTIVFGMVGAYFGVELAKWICDIRIKTGDSFAVPAAVAVSIGRLSCFAAGCCYGTPTTLPWGVHFQLADGGLVARHPTQLYESAFHLLIALMMTLLRQHGIWRGQLVKFYIISYLIYRWLTEFIRPEPKILFAFTGYQWFAIGAVPIFAWLWWRDSRQISLK